MKERFIQVFGGGKEPCVFAASGRVNLIGEHIDYNGGNVFPAAIGPGCFIYARENGRNELNAAFTTTDKRGTIRYGELSAYKTERYLNYIAGVCDVLQKAGVALTGLDVLYQITVPFGSGLSSSAAIEVATAYMLCRFADERRGTNFSKNLVQLALWAQKAENEYVGVNCGIMDQFASALGKKNKAILLDCATLRFEYVNFDLCDYALMIINTNRPHSLITGQYNERRGECAEALRRLQALKPELKNLCALSPAEFDTLKHVLDGKILNRATHCVYEQARVLKAADAMRAKDVKTLGALLSRSHESLKNLYEVSCRELDTIVDFARGYGAECAGARMTGAGFGGSAIAIVKGAAVDDFCARLQTHYREQTGLCCEILRTHIENGAREIIGF